MNIIKFDKSVKLDPNVKRVISLGKFSSFHLGHQEIFKRNLELAKEIGAESIVMLFTDKNEMNKSQSESILTVDERIDLLERFGFDNVLLFEPNVMNFKISGDEFMTYLKDNLNVTDIVVGEGFKFGSQRSHNIENLNKDFNTWEIPLLKIDDQIISSTLVSLMIEDRDFEGAEKALGFKWFFKARVIHGVKMGRELGFRTANVEYPADKIKIKEGIYFSSTLLKGKKYYSLTSISTNPTFDLKEIKYETHLLDYEGEDFYGDDIIVEIHKFWREPVKFLSKEELIDQIKLDKKEGIKYFNK